MQRAHAARCRRVPDRRDAHARAAQALARCFDSFGDLRISDRSLIFNTDLIESLELGQPARPVARDDPLGAEPHREPRRARARGLPGARRCQLDEAQPGLGGRSRRGPIRLPARAAARRLPPTSNGFRRRSGPTEGATAMAQFRLPANSRYTDRPGRHHPAAPRCRARAGVQDLPLGPGFGANPRGSIRYELDLERCGPMVLDALIKIKNEVDATVTFRRSCREGICGSCAMNIDGVNTLACTLPIEPIRGAVNIFPLPHMPVVKDLVPDLTQLLRAVRGRPAVAAGEGTRAAGCRAPAVAGRPGAHRPALGLHPLRLLFDVLPELLVELATDFSARRRCLRATAGSSTRATARRRSDSRSSTIRSSLYRCHTIMNCTEACPKDLNPARAIADIKRSACSTATSERCTIRPRLDCAGAAGAA